MWLSKTKLQYVCISLPSCILVTSNAPCPFLLQQLTTSIESCLKQVWNRSETSPKQHTCLSLPPLALQWVGCFLPIILSTCKNEILTATMASTATTTAAAAATADAATATVTAATSATYFRAFDHLFIYVFIHIFLYIFILLYSAIHHFPGTEFIPHGGCFRIMPLAYTSWKCLSHGLYST